MVKPRCTFRREVLVQDTAAYNRLRIAIRCRDKDLVQQLVDEGVKVNGIYEGGYREFDPSKKPSYEEEDHVYHPQFTPLHLAVMSRNAEIVKILLNKSADINAKVWNGETPLMMAANMQNTTIIDLLLNHNSIKNSYDSDGFAHLHIACMRNNVTVVRRLLLMNQGDRLNKPVSENSIHWAGYTALHFAVHFQCIETVEFLLKCGADITILNGRECSPLHLAHHYRNEEIIDLILKVHEREIKNPIGADDLSHFHIACTRDDTSIVEHFLNAGVDINSEAYSSLLWGGWRPIHFAMYYECHNVTRLLLKNKVQLENRCFSELLEVAYITANGSIYDPFLSNNIDSNLKNGNPEDKLLSILQEDYDDELDTAENILKLLQENEISIPSDLDRPIWNGLTSLHLAVKCGGKVVVKALLDYGASLVVQDAEGRTPLHLAFRNELHNANHYISLEISKYLASSTLDVVDNEGLSIFHILCALGCMKAVQNFLLTGVDINRQVGSESVFHAGFTPLHFAVKYNQPQVAEILLKHGADSSLVNTLGLNPFDFIVYLMSSNRFFVHLEKNLEILMKFLLHSSGKQIQLSNRGISIWHGLGTLKGTDLEQVKHFLDRDEIDKVIEFPPWLKFTPLHVAVICFRRFDIAELLLKNGANCQIVNDAGDNFIEGTFLFGIPEGKSVAEAERLFILTARNENFKPSHFHLACGSGLLYFVKSVLAIHDDPELKNSYINSLNDLGQTPLHSLMLLKNEVTGDEFVNFLLKHGADVHAKDFQLQTPLHYAQREIIPDVTRALINYGANVNAQNIFGETPLHKLLYDLVEGMDEVVISCLLNQMTSLLEGGFDVNITDRRGKTCLMIIPDLDASFLREGIARILLKYVKKLQLIGYYVNDHNKQACNEILNSLNLPNTYEADFVERCQQELESMKSEYFDRYTSLYSILFKGLNSMTVHCKNISLQYIIQSAEVMRKFPNYGSLIKLKVKNGQTRQLLLNEGEKSLRFILGLALPSQCVNTVLDYLSNKDLDNIIKSRQLRA